MSKNIRNKKILAATGMTLFSLVAVFVATVAWFAAVDTVASDGMKVRVKTAEDENSFSKMTIHRCMFNESDTTKYVFNPEPEYTLGPGQTDTGTFEMLDYDNNASALNRSQPVLLLFEFEEGTTEAGIRLTASTTNTTYPLSVTQSNVERYPFSHCVKFQSITSSAVSFNFTIPLTSLNPSNSFKSFAYINNSSTWDFSKTVVIHESSSSNSMSYLGVVMDYYDDSINHILESQNSSSSTIINNNGRLGFYCDWTMEL